MATPTHRTGLDEALRSLGSDATATLEQPGAPGNPTGHAGSENLITSPRGKSPDNIDEVDPLENDEDEEDSKEDDTLEEDDDEEDDDDEEEDLDGDDALEEDDEEDEDDEDEDDEEEDDEVEDDEELEDDDDEDDEELEDDDTALPAQKSADVKQRNAGMARNIGKK